MFESIFCHLVGSKKDYRHYVHEDENLLENCEKSDYEYVNVPCPVLSPSFSFVSANIIYFSLLEFE